MEEGKPVELDKVLLIGEGSDITIGKPVVEGAKVMATTKENGRDDKVIVFKYKPKVRYRRKNGHRQGFTSLVIDKILAPGAETKPAAKSAAKPAAKSTTKPAAKRMRRKKQEETTDGA